MDFLRHSLKQLIGVTPFTDGNPQGLSLELDRDQPSYADTNLRLSLEQRQNLYEYYTIQSSGILHHFSEEEVQSLLNDDMFNSKSRNRREDLAAFDAIEAQLSQGAHSHTHESSLKAYALIQPTI